MPSLPAAWATPEAHADLWLEQVINAAVNIGSMAFGIHMAIYAVCTYHLATKSNKKFPWFQQIYITILFILAAITIACNINFNELAWIDERSYPGGPLAFIQEQQAIPVDTIGNSAGVVITFMVDTLLIYRCYVVWGNNYYVVIFPILMLMASTVMSVLQTIAASQPASSLWAANAVRFGLPYFSLTMTLNMLVTIIIISRLLLARRKIRSALGANHGRMYTSVASMLIESALPSGLVSLVLIALYAQGNTAQILFFPLLPQVQAIAPQLIFIRVFRGRGWSSKTMTQQTRPTTDIQFTVSSGRSGISSNATRVKSNRSPTASHEMSTFTMGESQFDMKA